MSSSVKSIFGVFNILERELTGGGKQQTTEPYRHYEDTLDEIFGYVKDVFETNEKKKKEYRDSVKGMDKDCNCDKYKETETSTMKEGQENTPIVFELKDAGRAETTTKIKNEWIF